MKIFRFTLLLLFVSMNCFSQNEKYPICEGCEGVSAVSLKQCFKDKVTKSIVSKIKLPENVKKDSIEETINIVFFVDDGGKFELLYVNSPYKSLKTEVERVFKELPEVIPATYNNHNIEMQFVLPIQIPLSNNFEKEEIIPEYPIEKAVVVLKVDSLNLLEHKSELNLPYTHQNYASLDYFFNQGANSHTSVKPYLYSEIESYVDLDLEKTKLMKDKASWFGRKLWNEHLIQVQGEDYWFTIDPVFDVQIGKDNSDIDFTYNNTRGVQIQGSLGKKFSFSTTFC